MVTMIKALRPIPPSDSTKEAPLLHRLGWFLLLMIGGVTVVAATAYILRGLLLIGN